MNEKVRLPTRVDPPVRVGSTNRLHAEYKLGIIICGQALPLVRFPVFMREAQLGRRIIIGTLMGCVVSWQFVRRSGARFG